MIAYHAQDFSPPVEDPFKRPIPRETLQALARAASIRFKEETGDYFKTIVIDAERRVVVMDGTTEYHFKDLIQ